MSVTTMTLDALCVSPFNVRTNQADANAVDGLAQSLLKRGQLHPLTVHPMKNGRGKKRTWGAIAGGRRLRAFRKLIDAGNLPADHPIDVVITDISDEGELRELSLAENLPRRDLRSYEVYAAVANAHAAGRSLQEIAETNGQTVDVVRGWARLGNLHPTIFAALEDGEIGQDQAKALGATEDVALQLHVFEQISRHAIGDWRRGAAEIRKLMKVGDRELEKMLRFVGADAYAHAGGRYELDLFADQADQRGRVADEGLLLQMADAKLEAIRARVRRQVANAAGPAVLKFGSVVPRLMLGSYDQGVDHALEIVAEAVPGDAADAQLQAWLGYWMGRMEDQAIAAIDDADLDEATVAHIIAAIDEQYEPLEAMADQLQDRLHIALPTNSAYATLIVTDGGDAELRFWWADRKAKQKAEAAARKLPDAPEARPVSAGPIANSITVTKVAPAPLAGSGEAIENGGGWDKRRIADEAIRDEHGLTADGVQIMRTLRREMLRAMLVEQAEGVPAGDTPLALDYLVWSLARDRLTAAGIMQPGRQAHERGMAGLSVRHELVAGAAAFVDATQAHSTWKYAVDRIKAHPSMAGPDLIEAFDAYRAENQGFRAMVAAIVVGCALERSANAPGYQVALHDHLATLAGFTDGDQHELVEPTEELLDLLPRAKRLELVHPHVTHGEYLAIEKLKAAELSAPVVRALRRVKTWVHPMLRFSREAPGTLARTYAEQAA
ncbi:ParB/RepB/Spo0J family partition protein [Sphingobium abikonense]|uniref:ParB/RepB/Spo0J family partition protein n=1 Tax=Sphingobium abikonense TaxID=86193 RepID=UPI0035139184